MAIVGRWTSDLLHGGQTLDVVTVVVENGVEICKAEILPAHLMV